MDFKEVNIRDIKISPVELFNEKWSLITVGDENKHNTMTASWGMVGELWNKDVAVVFIRPTRYTYELIENADFFTVNFLGDGFKDALNTCGTVSGRDGDKFEKAGLTPFYTDGTTAIEEAQIVVVCKKLAITDFKHEGFLDEKIDGFYPLKDYHRAYVGQIIKVLQK